MGLVVASFLSVTAQVVSAQTEPELLLRGHTGSKPVELPDFEKNRTTAERRAMMVRSQIVARGQKDQAVLDAMRRVPRHEFVPEVFGGPGL